ncbi:MAG: MBOAT family O-acyltransferase [Kofleriaceae bacterium]|nr:MBOAT family O-acyltransferase [Kofleriaceae bacterium]
MEPVLFSSFTFLFLLTVVLLLDRTLPSARSKKLMILWASVAFYAAWKPIFILLMTFQAAVDWYASREIAATEVPWKRRAWLITSIGINLAVLAFFKYVAFFASSINDVSNAFGGSFEIPVPHIVLPIGISFYTFETISYTIDVYRREIKPTTSFLDYAVFITFFPHLVAGPIVRASSFLPQVADEDESRASRRRLGYGLFLFVVGLFQKLFIADAIFAPVVDAVYGAPAQASTTDAWLGTLAFSGQIYYDFSGYSTCAIGLAACLGITIADNFHSPYVAVGFSDFWRRWHISLSSWLKDYVYVPLGGNRNGRWNRYRNLVATMLLGGLWHGAAWTFVIWGALHGLLLLVEQAIRSALAVLKIALKNPAWTVLGVVLTYAAVCVTWVFFRAQSFADAGRIIEAMFGLEAGDGIDLVAWSGVDVTLAVLAIIAMLASHAIWRRGRFDRWIDVSPGWIRVAVLTIAIPIILVLMGSGAGHQAFIYFQF